MAGNDQADDRQADDSQADLNQAEDTQAEDTQAAMEVWAAEAGRTTAPEDSLADGIKDLPDWWVQRQAREHAAAMTDQPRQPPPPPPPPAKRQRTEVQTANTEEMEHVE